jgi:hypothetical protein
MIIAAKILLKLKAQSVKRKAFSKSLKPKAFYRPKAQSVERKAFSKSLKPKAPL